MQVVDGPGIILGGGAALNGRSLQEERRLEALRRYAAPGTLPQERFDRLARLAVRLFGVAAAGIAFLDGERQWFGASQGLAVQEVAHRRAFCQRTLDAGALTVVGDTAQDPHFNGSAAMYGRAFRFYAGVPLRTRGGFAIGTFCLFDLAPRSFGTDEEALLEDLAAMAMDEMELRERARKYRTLIERANVPILIFRPESEEILEANQEACATYGFAHDELVGASLRRLTADVPRGEKEIRHIMEHGGTRNFETVHHHHDGRLLHMLVSCSRIDYEGRPAVLCFERDITERKTAEEALRRSEARYRTLLEHLPVGVYRSTPEGRILEANTAMAALLGAEDAEALRQHRVQDLFVDKAERARHLEQLRAAGTCIGEFRLRRLDGQVVWVCDHPRAVAAEDMKGTAHFDGVLLDITERKRAEEALQKSEARLRAITKNTTDIIAILDEELTLQYLCGPVAEIVGFTPGELLGQNSFDYLHPEDQPRVLEAVQEALQHPERTIETEFRFRHREGNWRCLSVRGRNLLGQPGVRGLLCSVRDVTARKKAELELVAAKEEAEEMARLKSAFLANMSHEIRTPLTSLLGFADVLAEEIKDERLEFVELIQQGGRRLSETLNSVLDLARLEASALELSLVPVPVGEVVREVVCLFEPAAACKGLILKTDLPETDLLACADEAALSRVLTNLLSNAVKFTEEGHIRVRAYAQDGQVHIEMADTGIGMGEAFLSNLFDAFKQESTGLDRSHEGSGLGLTITERLVKLMEGSIAVDSTKDEGSTFTVSLEHIPSNPTENLMNAEKALATERESGERARVLVIEDTRDTRLLLKHLLRTACEAHIVAGPEEALAAAAETDYDAVFIDINLRADMDGEDVLNELRSDPRYAEVPIVALTAYAMPGDREHFLEAGFSDYLAKPFTREALYETLRRVVPL